MTIDLNCDVGEGFGVYALGADAELLRIATSANIACGFHAGSPATMRQTVEIAAREGVAIGAHPGLPDLEGFGRRRMEISPREVYEITLYQIGALSAFAHAAGERVSHVKAHGALYHLLDESEELANAFARAARDFDAELAVMGLPNSPTLQAAKALGLPVLREAFADRTYQPNGKLAPRSEAGALHRSPEAAAAQAVSIALAGKVVANDGTTLPLEADTICLHGDAPESAAFARAVAEALRNAGCELRRAR
jgi:UPF0271 protein